MCQQIPPIDIPGVYIALVKLTKPKAASTAIILQKLLFKNQSHIKLDLLEKLLQAFFPEL